MGTNKADDQPSHLVEAAAVAGGAAGLVVGGPAVGLVAAAGVAYEAATQDGAAGDAARATGQLALAIAEQAQEYNEEHEIVERSKQAAQHSLEEAKTYNEEHHVIERAKRAAVSSYRAVVAFEKKHQLIQKSLRAIQSGGKLVANKVTDCTTKDTTTK